MKNHRAVRSLRTVGVAAAGLGAYALFEPYRFKLTFKPASVTGLPRPVTVLHVSDTHMKAHDRRLCAFLGTLPDQLGFVPDLVVATGDLIEEDEGIDPVVEALTRLEANWGRFYVLGSHDYYLSEKRNYLKYFTGRGEKVPAQRADTEGLEDGLTAKGWEPLTNRIATLDTPIGKLLLAGVDDPYLKRHETAHITRTKDVSLAIGLVHAPEVVSEFALQGYDLLAAGHTHAGQVRIPGVGAVVTNCSLPSDLAGGLHRVGSMWLHVSPGLGAGRFTPVRFNAQPEATLLNLIPA